MNTIENVIQVVAKKLCQGRCGTQADDVNLLGLENAGYRVLKGVVVQLFHGGADVLHVAFQHGAQYRVGVDFRGHFKALHRRKPVADKFLQGALKLRIAFIAQHNGEAHHGGFADAHAFSQPAGGHEHGFIVMLHDVLCNAAVSLA